VAEPPAQASQRSWFDLLIDALALVSAALVVLLTVLILLDIAARYFRLFSLPWSLEAAEYMLYAITFLGAPWVLREEGHIAIELAVERLRPRWRARVRRLTDALGAAVCALLLYYACRVLWRSYDSGTMVRKSFVFPEWYVFAAVPLVMLVLLGIYLRWLARPPRPHAPEAAQRGPAG
jgi:TRAP-type C4-dicarboxylate transport system permease small subunit